MSKYWRVKRYIPCDIHLYGTVLGFLLTALSSREDITALMKMEIEVYVFRNSFTQMPNWYLAISFQDLVKGAQPYIMKVSVGLNRWSLTCKASVLTPEYNFN